MTHCRQSGSCILALVINSLSSLPVRIIWLIVGVWTSNFWRAICKRIGRVLPPQTMNQVDAKQEKRKIRLMNQKQQVLNLFWQKNCTNTGFQVRLFNKSFQTKLITCVLSSKGHWRYMCWTWAIVMQIANTLIPVSIPSFYSLRFDVVRVTSLSSRQFFTSEQIVKTTKR